MYYFSIGTIEDENIASHAYKTGSLYLLGILSKIFDEQPCPLSMGAHREENNLSKLHKCQPCIRQLRPWYVRLKNLEGSKCSIIFNFYNVIWFWN